MHSCCTLTYTQCQYFSQSQLTQMRLPKPSLWSNTHATVSGLARGQRVRRVHIDQSTENVPGQRWSRATHSAVMFAPKTGAENKFGPSFSSFSAALPHFQPENAWQDHSRTLDFKVEKRFCVISSRCPEIICHHLIHTTCPTIQRIHLKCFNINRMSGFAEKSFIPSTDDLHANKHYGKHWRAKKLT